MAVFSPKNQLSLKYRYIENISASPKIQISLYVVIKKQQKGVRCWVGGFCEIKKGLEIKLNH